MRHFDLTPLYRSTVGFDRLLTLLDTVAGPSEAQAYPPYNIERTGENAYRISMAVAGFADADLKIEVNESLLTVTGQKGDEPDGKQYLHRGIAGRSFERRFQLADYVEVTGADLRDGMLHIELRREVPEKLKPRAIAIGSTLPSTPKAIEHAAAA